MTTARAELVDLEVTRWYHCMNRCVRGEPLLGEGATDRKQWLAERLEQLTQIFPVSVGAFSLLDDRINVLVRLDPKAAARLSAADVARRWGAVIPPRNTKRQQLPIVDAWVRSRTKDAVWVATARKRLLSLGWFMRSLKEPLSRLANREEKTRGSFWESRYKSVAILDQASLLETSVYIDLCPVAAGLPMLAETGGLTSLDVRLKYIESGQFTGPVVAKQAVLKGKSPTSRFDVESWLCPIDDRRRSGATREGMIEGFTLADYLRLVEHTAKLFRLGNAPVSEKLRAVFERVGTDPETWQSRLLKLKENDPIQKRVERKPLGRAKGTTAKRR